MTDPGDCWFARGEYADNLLADDFWLVWVSSVPWSKQLMVPPKLIVLPLLGAPVTHELVDAYLGSSAQRFTRRNRQSAAVSDMAKALIQDAISTGTIAVPFAFALNARPTNADYAFMADYVSTALLGQEA